MDSGADKGTLWCAYERKRFPDSEFEQRGFDWAHVVGTSRHWTTGEPIDPEPLPVPPASRFERPLRDGEPDERADDVKMTDSASDGPEGQPEDDDPTHPDR